MRGLVYGCFSGLAASVPMTATMARLLESLPERDRFALPPAELVAEVGLPGRPAPTLTAHLLYGGLMGALFGMQRRRSAVAGASFGVGVWAASYLGWIPAAGLLAPATRHPARRNALMLIAHVVWGVSLAASLREIERAETAFTGDARERAGLANPSAARERGTR
jgi:uncharacterized membrane protein YagU involved in acid resistance